MKTLLFTLTLVVMGFCAPTFLLRDTVIDGYTVHIVKTYEDSQCVVLYEGFQYADTVRCRAYIGEPTVLSSPWSNYGSMSPAVNIPSKNIWYNYRTYTNPAGYTCFGVICFAETDNYCYEFIARDQRQSPANANYQWIYDQGRPVVVYAGEFIKRFQATVIVQLQQTRTQWIALRKSGAVNIKGQSTKIINGVHMITINK